MLVALLIAAAPAHADWPFARGGAESTGATAVALADEPELLWTYKAEGTGFEATPVIAAGVAYLGDADGTMHAVRLADGSKVWSRKLGETFLLSPAAAFAPMATNGESVPDCLLVHDADGVLHALDTKDGKERWRFESKSEAYGGPTFFGLGEAGWIVLLPTEAGVLYGLDLVTGEERWTFKIEAPLRGTPTVVNGHALLAGCDGKLHTVEVATGKAVGSCDIGDPTGNTAAVLDGVAYFGTEGGAFYAIDARDPADPKVRWRQRDAKRGQGVRTAAAVGESAIIYANQAKTLYARSPADGELFWTARTRSKVEASPLVLAGGRVLVLTGRGRARLLDLGSGDEVWSYNAGGGFIASPAASDGRILVANTDGSLLCFGKE